MLRQNVCIENYVEKNNVKIPQEKDPPLVQFY